MKKIIASVKAKEICPRCGREVKSYKVYITQYEWVCSQCGKDVESYG